MHAGKNFKIVLASPELSPILIFVAQQHTPFLDSSMVEHAAVNRGVVGSSPTGGARQRRHMVAALFLFNWFRDPNGPLAQLVRAVGS